MNTMRQDAEKIIKESISSVLPDEAVMRALKDFTPGKGKVILVAAGKAAWQMAHAAVKALGSVNAGIVITKYGHVNGAIPGIVCYEAGHPVPDENSFAATEKALSLVSNLRCDDTVLFLLSGGGSALFESPLIPGEELQKITEELLSSGADIVSINTIRKRLSKVKGGRFALKCMPAKVFSIILSDIIGNPLDMIASGPAYPDASTCEQALDIAKKYNIKLSEQTKNLLMNETPKALSNISTYVTGSVQELCKATKISCEKLGYKTIILTDELSCEASEAGNFLGSIAKSNRNATEDLAFIAGGETIVHLKGTGKGGRNQELALSAAFKTEGIENVAVFSIGSDGTDGPTDAAGGYVDGATIKTICKAGYDPEEMLSKNDSYNALRISQGLIMTGPTGTNVNDVSVVLIRKVNEHVRF